MKTLIVDTREQSPWDTMSFNLEKRKLDEGDYTLKEFLDYEEKTGKKTIRIERKKTPAELAGNLGKLYKQFEREIQRLQQYDEKYIICEFSLDELSEYPKGADIPNKFKHKVRMTGKFMLTRIDYLCRQYDINIIYANNRPQAIITMTELFNEYAKKIQG